MTPFDATLGSKSVAVSVAAFALRTDPEMARYDTTKSPFFMTEL